MIYDLAILRLRPNTLGPVLSRLPETVPAAVKSGTLIGCFMCEFGVLNRIAILSAYDGTQACMRTGARSSIAATPMV
jgi:hypothetical protein